MTNHIPNRLPTSQKRHACIHCHQKMAYIDYQRSKYCSSAQCQKAMVSRYILENKKSLNKAIQAIVIEALTSINIDKFSSTNQQSIQDGTAENIAVLPTNLTQTSRLPEERKTAFRKHLTELFNAITNQSNCNHPVYDTQLNPRVNDKHDDLLAKACATCKGKCCSLGRNHAFQDIVSLSFFIKNYHQSLTLKELLALYEQYFPNTSYQKACVFQGEVGCTLPEELRSFTCRNYRCEELRAYHQALITTQQSLTFAAATVKNEIMFLSVYDNAHYQEVK